MIGILGTGLALCLLIYLSYRGLSVLLVAPLMALLAVALSGTPVLASYTQVFMPTLVSFLVQYFPLFLLGAVFGKLMDDSGAARALAEAIVSRLGPTMTIPAIVLACSVLTYGGVSLFVVAFAAYPIAAQMFERARIARSLIPASIALGAFTFTMTALPGTPSIQNAIPMPYFGTTAFAAPGLGLIAGTIMAGGGLAWLIWRSQMSSAKFAPETRTTAPIANEARPDDAACALPPVYQAALPVALVVALNYLFSVHILPALDTSHLAEERFGAIGFASVRGTWSILSALSISIVVLLLLNRHRLKKPAQTLDEGATAAIAPAFNTASLVGFGAIVASLPAFAAIRDSVLAIAPGNPLVSLAVSANILAGITGSASGGMSIALQALGGTYLDRAISAGIDPDLLHRVTALATGGLDALPHNGAVITLLAVCKMTQAEAYKDIFVVACAIPIVALIAVLAIAELTGSF